MTNERFYMYWYWQMHAHLGLARTALESGNIANARTEANCFLQSTLSTSDPNMQALAWEIKTEVAIAEEDWVGAVQSVRAALAILEKHQVPVSEWRVHATAWELYRRQENHELAESHRISAEAGILTLAHSFPHDEPLRDVFFAAGPVRRILRNAPAKKKETSTNG